MPPTEMFELPVAAVHASYLAQVVAVDDPLQLGRVQLRLFNFDGMADQDAPIWARVAVPFAGGKRGAFMLPDVGDEVIVTLLNGDPRFPVVIGGLWNGKDGPPETLGGDGSRVDRWTIVGKRGTRIAIVEETAGQATISLTTPNGGPSLVIEQTAGGTTTLNTAGSTITVDPGGFSLKTPAKVTIQASQVEVTAGQVTVNAAMSSFSGVVRCDTLIASTVVSTTYTPGVGNVW
jgi:uncharacterized protein involved in type VI secretion and phage assembly